MANNFVFIEIQGFQRYLAQISLSRKLALGHSNRLYGHGQRRKVDWQEGEPDSNDSRHKWKYLHSVAYYFNSALILSGVCGEFSAP
jgi:hypothetical protein